MSWIDDISIKWKWVWKVNNYLRVMEKTLLIQSFKDQNLKDDIVDSKYVMIPSRQIVLSQCCIFE